MGSLLKEPCFPKGVRGGTLCGGLRSERIGDAQVAVTAQVGGRRGDDVVGIETGGGVVGTVEDVDDADRTAQSVFLAEFTPGGGVEDHVMARERMRTTVAVELVERTDRAEIFAEPQVDAGVDLFAQLLRGLFLRGVGTHRGVGTDGEFDLGRKARVEPETDAERMPERMEEVVAGEVGRLVESVVHRDVYG